MDSIINRQRLEALNYFGNSPLLVSPTGVNITLAQGYIPLLVNFTTEDKAAKGLRKRNAEDKPEAAVYFSALEVVRDNKVVLLSGPSGSGKTTFAKRLCFDLARGGSIEPRPLYRNEEGAILDEQWENAKFSPCYYTMDGEYSLEAFKNDLPEIAASFRGAGKTPKPNLLIILDTIEKDGEPGATLFTELFTLVKEYENIKLLLLGNTSTVKQWVLPSDVVRHDLLPLLQIQRRQRVSGYTDTAPSEVEIGIGRAAAIPVYFSLALESRNRGQQAEELLDAWSSRAGKGSVTLFWVKAVQQLITARMLVDFPPEKAITIFHRNPQDSEPILRSLLVRLSATNKSGELIQGLISGSGTNAQLGALLVSDLVTPSSELALQISNQMLAIIEEKSLPALQREQAGRILSRLGDTRDLTALASVPGGDFILGSEDHPNSQPVERMSLNSFRIGMYPVVNQDYAIFVRETGRKWQSPDGFDPEKQNVPATDLSWYDVVF